MRSFSSESKPRSSLKPLHRRSSCHLFLGGVGEEIMDLDYLAANRVRLCLQGHQPIAAAYRAVHETMKALREGTKPAGLKGLPSGELTSSVKRMGNYDRWIDEFLGGN